jgi:hypothetical protein
MKNKKTWKWTSLKDFLDFALECERESHRKWPNDAQAHRDAGALVGFGLGYAFKMRERHYDEWHRTHDKR